MARLVQKFGGSSVSSLERIQHVAGKIIETAEAGHQIIVVLSAMGNETTRLSEMAHNLVSWPDRRELDVLLATGEQVTIALLCMALIDRGHAARSYTGAQVHIRTDNAHNKARILDIDQSKIEHDLNKGYIVVVAGFQGSDEHGNITTLGRGGSDTTAAALAAALKADECQIYTDVDGVFTTDPRIEPKARLLERVTFEEMLELSSLGAKVLQIRAVEFAGRYKIPLRVLNTEREGKGTLIAIEDKKVEQPTVSGIAFTKDEAKLTLSQVPDVPGLAARILVPISDANIEVDMIIQNASAEGTTDFTFTVHRNDCPRALAILQGLSKEIGCKEIFTDDKIAKISLVGVGMRSHAGIASTMFEALASESINIQMITTSEIKVSVVIDEKYLELGVRSLHAAFELAAEPKEEPLFK